VGCRRGHLAILRLTHRLESGVSALTAADKQEQRELLGLPALLRRRPFHRGDFDALAHFRAPMDARSDTSGKSGIDCLLDLFEEVAHGAAKDRCETFENVNRRSY
jgi:hypothetical protein